VGEIQRFWQVAQTAWWRGSGAAKVIQKVVDAGAEAEAILDFGIAQALLEGAEEALRSRQSKCPRAKFSQDSMPSLNGHSHLSPWKR
jgi:hypothetical protein